MTGARRPRRLGDSAGIRVAACVAGLLLAAGLIVRMSVGLSPDSPQATQQLGGGGAAIALSSDAAGRPLFDEVELLPGEPVEACVEVRAHGSAPLEALGLHVTGYTGSPQLAAALLVRVEHRTGPASAAAGSCAGYVPEAVLVEGTLEQVVRAHDAEAEAVRAPASAARTTSWYRVRVELPPDAQVGGRIDDLGLVWTTAPLPVERSAAQAAAALAMGLAETSAIPLLLMLVASVLFVGVQERIDRADPKLALAPPPPPPVPFVEPSALALPAGRDVAWTPAKPGTSGGSEAPAER